MEKVKASHIIDKISKEINNSIYQIPQTKITL